MRNLQEDQREEDGISNRQFSATFIPLVTLLEDEDNYVKWSWNWHGGFKRTVLALNQEIHGQIVIHRNHILDYGGEGLWLRITRARQRHVFSWSADGEAFSDMDFTDLEPRAPQRLGWIAKNGSGSRAAEIPVHVESVEVWSMRVTHPDQAGLSSTGPAREASNQPRMPHTAARPQR